MTYTRYEMLNTRAIRRNRYKQAWMNPIHPDMLYDPRAQHPTFRYSNIISLSSRTRVLSVVTAEPAPDGNYTGEWLADTWVYPAQSPDGNALVEQVLLLEPPHLTIAVGPYLQYETAGFIEWKAWLHTLHIQAGLPRAA